MNAKNLSVASNPKAKEIQENPWKSMDIQKKIHGNPRKSQKYQCSMKT